MTDIVKNNFALPAEFGSNLMKGLSDTRAGLSVTAGGQLLMRLLRTGQFVFGQNNELVEKGSEWAVNLASLSRGWVCWGDGVLLGQVMASVQVPWLNEPAPIQGVPFQQQFSFEMTCLSGKHDGVSTLYKGNSYGFKGAFDQLIGQIQARYGFTPNEGEKRFFWPIIVLKQESYAHKKYGQIFNPILEIVGWADENGDYEEDHVPAPAPEPVPEPVKATRQRNKPAAPPQVEVPQEPPVSTQQAHAGQRRRPQSR